MKQLLLRLDSGTVELMDVPAPAPGNREVVVRTHASVLSAGTERMLVEFGRSSLVDKARQQPEKVRQVLDKVRTEGVASTFEAVQSKLSMPIPLGYCQAGVVEEVGREGAPFRRGQRVVTNGPHAEYVRVPRTLAAAIPDSVSFDNAAFTPVAAIGLQGIRLARPELGETVVVVGLGLIGLLTVQMLRANGCRVIGVDRDSERLALAQQFGAIPLAAGDTAVEHALAATGGVGVDAVLLTLASSSQDPIRQAAAMCRKRGRLVLVGTTGLNLVRDDFYKKELSLTVSCSYGPGRYDPVFEEEGRDYPLPYVRWTEQRNFDAVLGLMDAGVLDPAPLISHRIEFNDAVSAYDVITKPDISSLGVVLTYPAASRETGGGERVVRTPGIQPGRAAGVTAGVIGAGNFAVRTLLPILRRSGIRLHTIASSGGTSGAVAARKFGIENSTTDIEALISDREVNTVFVLTRHDSHASLVVRALESGKNVFVEKPLALSVAELDQVESAARSTGGKLLVGFNRRFAPLAVELRQNLAGRAGPAALIMTVNAGAIPRDHWTQDPDRGGGRIAGEACHWLDLARFLAGSPIAGIQVTTARNAGGDSIDDIAHIALSFEDGSTAAVNYVANGATAFPKERIDCFWDGATATIDNWRSLTRHGHGFPWRPVRGRIDKGHASEMREWLRFLSVGGEPPIPLAEMLEVTRWSIRAAELARTPLTVRADYA